MDKQTELMELCRNFIIDNKISCSESIYQCDCVNENACELIEKICNIVGYYKEHQDHQNHKE